MLSRAGAKVLLAAGLLFLAASALASGKSTTPCPGTRTLASSHSFATLVARLRKAIAANNMGLVAQASASRGAATRGVTIPGNAMLMIFRNDYAVRMLKASIPAGIEAPLRLYVTENSDGTASITYRTPSALFAPYGQPDLDTMAQELDAVVHQIVHDAIAP